MSEGMDAVRTATAHASRDAAFDADVINLARRWSGGEDNQRDLVLEDLEYVAKAADPRRALALTAALCIELLRESVAYRDVAAAADLVEQLAAWYLVDSKAPQTLDQEVADEELTPTISSGATPAAGQHSVEALTARPPALSIWLHCVWCNQVEEVPFDESAIRDSLIAHAAACRERPDSAALQAAQKYIAELEAELQRYEGADRAEPFDSVEREIAAQDEVDRILGGPRQ